MKTLIQFNLLSKTYGHRNILNGASLSIFEKQKIGVIGRNGAGKTTLINIIVGDEEADSGDIQKSRELKLGYLKQSSPFQEKETVMDYLVRSSNKEDWQCGQIAGRFQLKNELLEMPVTDLSGGFQMRAKLASMLLEEPNFLILDEPTNYLDLNTLLLLEDFLKQYNGGFMLISHDREFLKNTCSNTLEVDQGKVFLFPGKLEEYLEYKEQQILEAQRQNKNTETKRKELETFVDRFRAKASKASQAQSKLKQLNKLQKIDIDHPMQNVKIRIPDVYVRKGAALIIQDLSAGYSGNVVLDQVDLNIARGSKVAILGDNGQGKSTLLKTIAGRIKKIAGNYDWKEKKIGFYAQHVYSTIDETLSVTDYLKINAASDVSPQQVLDMAGSFLFSGDDAKKKIKVLSGGERGRLCLAGLLLGKFDVLLLDEPTNHLDFETVEALGFALKKFQGTLLFVSHDRTFVNLIATEIIEIKSGKAKIFPGNYPDYIYHLRNDNSQNPGEPKKKTIKETTNHAKEKNKFNNVQKKNNRSDLKKIQKEISNIDASLKELGEQKEEILVGLNSGNYTQKLNEQLKEIEKALKLKETRWMELQTMADSLEKGLK